MLIVPPYFREGLPEDPSSERSVLANHPFSLTCDPVGVPFPTFVWHRDGTPLPRDALTSVWGNRLDVASAREYHAGLYHCEASNLAGSVQQSYNITVLGGKGHA